MRTQANAEMTVAVRSDSLGTVQVHASLQNNVLGATLSADRADVHHWLSAQLPALEQTLTARQMQVGSLQLQAQTSTGGNAGNAPTPGQPQSQGRSFAPARMPAPNEAEETAVELIPTPHGGSRLNLRA
ncbi:MAG: flagellar hook-length control protein FliK [Terriglobales bacterium]